MVSTELWGLREKRAVSPLRFRTWETREQLFIALDFRFQRFKFWPPFAASCFPKPWSSPPVVWLWRKESSHTSGVSLDGGDWGGALTEVEVESRPLGKSSPTTLTCDSRSVSTTTSCCAPSSRRPATCISVEVAASRRTCLGQHTQSKARSVHLGRHVR